MIVRIPRWLGVFIALMFLGTIRIFGGDDADFSDRPVPLQALRDDGICVFAYDGQCDHPDGGTGACAAGTDVADCGGPVAAGPTVAWNDLRGPAFAETFCGAIGRQPCRCVMESVRSTLSPSQWTITMGTLWIAAQQRLRNADTHEIVERLSAKLDQSPSVVSNTIWDAMALMRPNTGSTSACVDAIDEAPPGDGRI